MAVAVPPRDPLAIRLTGYVPHRPHPPQHAFLALNVPEALYGGAAGGGKSDALLMAALQYVDVPGYAAIIFRRTYADLSKPGALMDRARTWLGPTDARWRDREKAWTFPSGASLSFGYLFRPDDKFNYQSAEYQFVGFDELSQFEESDYRYLFSRLRKPAACVEHQHARPVVRRSELVCEECGTPAPALSAVPLRARGASNPGGRGHKFVRDRFIKKKRSEYDDELGVDPRERAFVPAKLADNPSLDYDSYVKQLSHLDPQTRKQLLDGDWEARDPGACFTEFSWDAHTVEDSRHPESTHLVCRAIDFGLHHAPCLWLEVYGRSAFVFAEYDSREQDLHKMADDVREVDAEFGLSDDTQAYIDPAGLGTNYQTGKTDADVLQEHGIAVANLDNTDRYGREQRTSFIKYMLRTRRLFVSRDCEYLIDSLERAEWDRHPGTGALKDCYRKDGYWEHPLDALGEALIRIFRPFPPAAAEATEATAVVATVSAGGSEYG